MMIVVMMRARRLMMKSRQTKSKRTRSHSKLELNKRKRQEATQRKVVLMALKNLLETFSMMMTSLTMLALLDSSLVKIREAPKLMKMSW